MNQKTKIAAGLIVLCLVSAMIASFLTAVLLIRGVFGYRALLSRIIDTDPQLSAETTLPRLTPTQPVQPTPVPTAKPTPTPPKLTPTPAETEAIATPSASETESDNESGTLTETEETNLAGSADEQLQLWQDYDLIENIYTQIRPSVIGINVEIEDNTTGIRRTNQGSGLIMNEDGIIVTNGSVLAIALDKQGRIQDQAKIEISVYGIPRVFLAELVGRDPLTDLAVLAIDPGYYTLVPAAVAETAELNVGQMIIAVGYPDIEEESGNLYSGLISGLNRPVQLEDGTTLQMIQTDARINQRCSGGPLLNLSGEVIALTNCGLARPAYDLQSYAMPITTAQMVVQDLTSQGYVAGRSWLGVSVLVEETFLQLQNLYGFPSGLYISQVIDDSPAYTADLRRGDIITEINDQPVEPSMNISQFLQSQPVGSLVRLQVYRRSNSQYYNFRVYLQEYAR